MKINIIPLTEDCRTEIMDIFNYYVENSFAAYPESKLPYEFFDHFLKMCEGYPALIATEDQGTVMGFAMLRAYNPFPTFSHTAEITYFIRTGYTGRGIGKLLLDSLIFKAREHGITSVIATISSINEGSINFHKKNGFVECGRLKEVGRKKGQTFDVVYMQKMI